jgi:hypothetical protein
MVGGHPELGWRALSAVLVLYFVEYLTGKGGIVLAFEARSLESFLCVSCAGCSGAGKKHHKNITKNFNLSDNSFRSSDIRV